MAYTLKQAAEATGKSKPTILRAIQTGKISASRHPLTQGWLIEPAELHRIYPPVPEDEAPGDTHQSEPSQMTHGATAAENAVLRREAVLKDELLATAKAERDHERRCSQETIDDLRRRLDLEGEERRRTQAQLTALLKDQRPRHEFVVDPLPRRSWWRFGR
jgi:hypothetical protein